MGRLMTNEVERALYDAQSKMMGDNVPDFEMTQVRQVRVSFTLDNGSEVTFTMDGMSVNIDAGMRLMFDPEYKPRGIMQMFAYCQDCRVTRSGVATWNVEVF
jgi:hypothetical protein